MRSPVIDTEGLLANIGSHLSNEGRPLDGTGGPLVGTEGLEDNRGDPLVSCFLAGILEDTGGALAGARGHCLIHQAL